MHMDGERCMSECNSIVKGNQLQSRNNVYPLLPQILKRCHGLVGGDAWQQLVAIYVAIQIKLRYHCRGFQERLQDPSRSFQGALYIRLSCTSVDATDVRALTRTHDARRRDLTYLDVHFKLELQR